MVMGNLPFRTSDETPAPRVGSMGTSAPAPGSLQVILGRHDMLSWALTFLILALVAGLLGFFGLAGLAASIAKLLLFAFLVLFLISALSGALRGRAPPI